MAVKSELPKSNADALKKDGMSNKITTIINEVLGDQVVKSLTPTNTVAKQNKTKHLAFKFTE